MGSVIVAITSEPDFIKALLLGRSRAEPGYFGDLMEEETCMEG